ncbi:MAG: hypothetical protein U9R72_04740 [Chloroflexota bacterium]|nr:hypothetical protein [Chloroflexota bacterium]
MTEAAERRNIARYQLLLLLAVYLLSASLRIDSGDGETMYRVAHSLVTGEGVAIPATQGALVDGRTGYGRVGTGGLYYSKYGLGWSLAAVPFCAAGRMIAPVLTGATEGFVTRAAVMLLNPLLTAATAVLLLQLACRLYTSTTAATLSLLYGLGTIAWYYAKSAFSEPIVTLLLLAALCAVERNSLMTAGVMLGGMILTRQTAILMVIPVTTWAVVRGWQHGGLRRLRGFAALLLPIGLGQLIAVGYNTYRFGNPLHFGYGTATWDTPFLQGVYNQLLSPGKGLFVFMPVLLLSLVGWPALLDKRRDWAWLVLLAGAVYLVPHALYGHWSGGGGWGPRLLLPIVPLLLLPAGEVIERWETRRAGRVVLVLLIALSLFIQVLGVSVNWARHLQRVRRRSSTRKEYFQRVHHRWRDSPIPGQVRSLREALGFLHAPERGKRLESLVSREVKKPLRDWQSEAVGLLSFNVPDFWFVYLWFLGVSPRWLISVALLLSGTAVGAALQLRQALDKRGHQTTID